MLGKMTCSTCGMVWFSGDDCAKDKVKCGKPSLCPLLASSERNSGTSASEEMNNILSKAPMNLNNWPYKRVKEPKIKVHIGTVPNKYDDTKDTYYVEVPKVIVTTQRWK